TSKISVIHEGLDLDEWHPMRPEQVREKKRRLGLPEDAVVIGFAGRLIPIKRPDSLIATARELIARYPRLHFVILGDGPLRPVLEAQAAELGERFRILGWQPTTHWLPAVDILVQPSEIDAVPRSIMEAMACGIPVVATRVGGISECVNHG